MYDFRQVDKHKSRPDSSLSCVSFAFVNMLVLLKKEGLLFLPGEETDFPGSLLVFITS